MTIDCQSMTTDELDALYARDDDDVADFLVLWELEEPEPWELLLGPQDPI